MNETISVVLPVRNAQANLAAQVERLLDMVPDLSSRFEILIVDDASTDRTEEVAHELVSQFPQVRFSRHDSGRGETAAEGGVTLATGDIVFVCESNTVASARELKALWSMKDERQLALAQTQRDPQSLDRRLIQRLMRRKDPARGGLQMIRRSALRDVSPEHDLDSNFRVDQVAEPENPSRSSQQDASRERSQPDPHFGLKYLHKKGRKFLFARLG